MESLKKKVEHLRIPLQDIVLTTNNFEIKPIGSGGFGPVYRGELVHYNGRSVVAIKRLNREHGQGNREFWKEITILTSHTHKNLISLLGFCDEGDENILVYEYASNGSLDAHLGSTKFTWTQRLMTCLDVARVISYLHEERVFHRDIKASNILLDENWNAKLSDMGLSKIVLDPGHVTDVVGTRGYVDPEYQKDGFLTESVDVYAFGCLLLEVLCGTLCYDKINGEPLLIVWEKSYKQNKLQENIFVDLKQQMDPSCLKAYSDTAYKCLQKSLMMPQVVKELETALAYQNPKMPKDYKKMLMITEEDPLNNKPETELKILLLEGILRNMGKTWFSLNMNGDHCEMISIAACLTSTASEPQQYITSPEYTSRFAMGCYEPSGANFNTYVRTQFLSPKITYTVNLVFKRKRSKEQYIGLEYKIVGEKGKSYSFVSDERDDGWLTAELYQFTSDKETVDLEILFFTKHCDNLRVESIEFLPLEKVEHEDKVNLAINYEETGEKWFYGAKDGKKCLMLPAKEVLDESEWKWISKPETRFGQVADCISKTFDIFCKISPKTLSPQTIYATYLVYKLPHDFHELNPPLQVVDEISGSGEEYNIFLRTPLTPVIIRENMRSKRTYNPSIRPRIKGLPKLRSDGWMEVQVHEFQTHAATINMISTHLGFSSYDMSLEGIIVQSLEFRPV